MYKIMFHCLFCLFVVIFEVNAYNQFSSNFLQKKRDTDTTWEKWLRSILSSSSSSSESSPQKRGYKSWGRSSSFVVRDEDFKIEWAGGVIGQPASVAICDKDYFYIFHRADRENTNATFDENFYILNTEKIPVDTIIRCHVITGKCDQSLGKNLFLLPHAISISPVNKNQFFLTDVGRHQVIAINIKTGIEEFTLGTYGVPVQGDDPGHFCKPTNAKIDPVTGQIFVSDGYCNARVAVFKSDRTYKTSIKGCDGSELRVPHDLAIDATNRILYVAGRENNRICIYSIKSSSFGKELNVIKRAGAEFALNYNPGFIYTAERVAPPKPRNYGSVIDIRPGHQNMVEFEDDDMTAPHGLSVWDNRVILIADLYYPGKIIKFFKL